MRQLLVIILVVVIFLLFLPPVRVHAEITPTEQLNPGCIRVETNLCVPTDVGAFVQQYYAWGLGMIGGLAVLFIMFGGYIVLTSKGDPVRLNNGKSFIGYAIIGLLMAIFGYAFVELIVIDVLKLPGFTQ